MRVRVLMRVREPMRMWEFMRMRQTEQEQWAARPQVAIRRQWTLVNQGRSIGIVAVIDPRRPTDRVSRIGPLYSPIVLQRCHANSFL